MIRLTLIDTSAWLFALGPKAVPTIKLKVISLVENNLAAITSPIFFELISGARTEEEASRLENYLSALHSFPFAAGDWVQAAVWTNNLRRRGLSIKTVDALIAWKATRHNLILLHADSDFNRIARYAHLRVESLTAFPTGK
ncbi:MAG: PIN domain-containing protein [Elusimicrobia bacterium]|nr:PIN domain-containing protein [Elusimicrobiota bacterium]